MGSASKYTDLQGVVRHRDINPQGKNAQGVDIFRERSDVDTSKFTEADKGALLNAAASLGLSGGAGLYFFDGSSFMKLLGGEMAEATVTAGNEVVTAANRQKLLACSLIPMTAASPVSVGTAATKPILPDGYPGQELTLLNTGANAITLTDQGTMAASNLRLQAATIVLTQLMAIKLIFSSAIGDWVQHGPTADTVAP